MALQLADATDPYRPPAAETRLAPRRTPDDVGHGAWLAFLAWAWTPTLVFWAFVVLRPARVLPTAGQLLLFFGFVAPVAALWTHACRARTRRTALGLALGGGVGFLVSATGVLALFGLAG